MIRITVPATSANMGAGFDALGIALGMNNIVEMEVCDRVDIASLDDTPVPTDRHNLIYRTAEALYQRAGRTLSGLRLRQHNEIPMARGLGSSSACIVAGLLGANELMGRPFSTSQLVDIAAETEGHPDNVVPAFLGGQITAAIENGHVFCCKTLLPADLRFLAVIPDCPLPTEHARAVLPQTVPHADARFNLARSALMAVSLATGQYQNLRVAAQDALHQTFRMPLIPGGEQTLRRMMELGAYCAYLSGAGSTMLAMMSLSAASGATQTMRRWLDENGLSGWRVELFSGVNNGAYTQKI